jgi:hypothetical protein
MKKGVFLVVLLGVLALASCKKEGCTDANATNFDSEAKKENNTCNYEGDLVFWYNEATSEFLQDNLIISLTYYVNDVVVGSSASNVFFTGVPECGQNGAITVTKDLGIAKNKSYDYKIVSDSDETVWEGTQNFTANTCTSLELTE